MKTIQKTMSLEPMTSRLPSIWPAYLDNTLYYFDEKSLKEREYQYTSNYGMIPLNVGVDSIPNSGISEYAVGCAFTLSWSSLSDWYHFFTEYYNLLKHYGHCGRVYTSAEDYYNYESFDKYADQMIYGSDIETYRSLDKEFAEKGGIVDVQIHNKETGDRQWVTPDVAHDEEDGDETAIIDVQDKGFFKWICDNVVPTFVIPSDKRDAWKRDTLFYPDVLRWIPWFQERNIYEGKDCKDMDDCCDCEKYVSLGGSEMCKSMEDWVSEVNDRINENTNAITDALTDCDKCISDRVQCYEKNDKDCYEKYQCHYSGCCLNPHILLPIHLQTSIDDLGEESIFSKEYNLGEEYKTIKTTAGKEKTTIDDYSDGNTHTGTTAVIDGIPFILSGNESYQFDTELYEKYVSECNVCHYRGVFAEICPKCGSRNVTVIGWDDYSQKYIDGNSSEFAPDNKYCAYDIDNVIYYTSASTESAARTELENKMKTTYSGESYSTREDGWFFIEGGLYEITHTEYGTYNNNSKYLSGTCQVYRDKETMTPYAYVNGRLVYAEFDYSDNKFHFPFFNESFERHNESKNKKYYITYNGTQYDVMLNTNTTIDGSEATYVSGYWLTKSGDYVYTNGINALIETDYGTLEEFTEGTVNNGAKTLEIAYPFPVEPIPINIITGRTISKLYDLKSRNLLTDDVGNEIDGIYNPDRAKTLNHQPPQYQELDPIYQVGNTANVERFSKTSEDVSRVVNWFVGDIITEMRVYFRDENGLETEGGLITLQKDGTPDKTVLEAIEEAKESKEEIESGNTYVDENGNPTDELNYAYCINDYVESGGCIAFSNDIYCDITYYVGATLRRDEGKMYILADEDKAPNGDTYNNKGVKYTETVKFVRETRQYFLKKPKKLNFIPPMERNEVAAHSISYPIYTYALMQDLEYIDGYAEKVPMANFETEINIYEKGSGNPTYTEDMAKRNNLEVYPTFREEYRLGISSMENVESDIYIERGINAAFEKHLKLGEVTSLEALEQYGNSYFKIMDS